MKTDISKKYLRKVNTIEICSTMTAQDVGARAFTGSKLHILVDVIGGRHYLNAFEKALKEESEDITVTIGFIGGIDGKGKPIDNRNDMQKLALINAVKEVVYWMYCERLDLTDLKLTGTDIAFNPKKEYSRILISEGYKVKALCA